MHTHMCEVGLSNWHCLSVCLSVHCNHVMYGVKWDNNIGLKKYCLCIPAATKVLIFSVYLVIVSIGSKIQKYGHTRTLTCVHNQEALKVSIPRKHTSSHSADDSLVINAILKIQYRLRL